MFEATVDINAKDYNACTLYYLKKFVGVKEYILVGFLLIGGLVLFFAFNQWLILALCGVTVLLMAAAIVVYIALARKGYREEFVKRNTHEWKFWKEWRSARTAYTFIAARRSRIISVTTI